MDTLRVTVMRKVSFFKCPSEILVAIGIGLWLIGFLFHERVNHSELIWLPFLVVQLCVSWFCGILINKLHYSAYKDTLTGLHNRKYFYKQFKNEMERLKRTGFTDNG